MWSVVFTVAVLCGVSYGSPLFIGSPSPLTGRPLTEVLATPETRARLVEEIEGLMEESALPCMENVRTTLFVALLHMEGNLVALETGHFKELQVAPLLARMDTTTRNTVVEAVYRVSKELLEKPILEELELVVKKNVYYEKIFLFFRHLELAIKGQELFTVNDLKMALRPLLTSLREVRDCSLVTSRDEVLGLCQKIIVRLTTPGVLEESMKTLQLTLRTTIKDTVMAGYIRDTLEILTTKYVSMMTYTFTSLETLLRSGARPTTLLVDWMYCMSVLPFPSALDVLPFSDSWTSMPARSAALVSITVPAVSPLSYLAVHVHTEHLLRPTPAMHRLRAEVVAAIGTLNLPSATDPCYTQKLAAYNAVLVLALHGVDRTLLDTTLLSLIKPSFSSALFENENLVVELRTLLRNLITPEIEAVNSLLEIPELKVFLARSKLTWLIKSATPLAFPEVFSALKEDIHLIRTSEFLCNIETTAIVSRIHHVLGAIKTCFSWETVESKLITGLKSRIASPELAINELITHLKPVFHHYTHHQYNIINGLTSCLRHNYIEPSVLAHILVTLKAIESGTLLDLATPVQKFDVHIKTSIEREIPALGLPLSAREWNVPKISSVSIREKVMAALNTVTLPSPLDPCYQQKLAAYNAVLVLALHEVNRLAINNTLITLARHAIFRATIAPHYTSEHVKYMAETWRSVANMIPEILAPETEAIGSLLEVPEMATFLRTSHLALHISSGLPLPLSHLIAAISKDINLINKGEYLCTADCSILNSRLERVLAIMKRSCTWNTFERKLTSLAHPLSTTPIVFTDANIAFIKPIFAECQNLVLAAINELLSDVRAQRLRPELLISVLTTREHIRTTLCHPAALREHQLAHSETARWNPAGAAYPTLRENLLSEIRTISLPSSTDPCFSQKHAAYHSLLVMVVHSLDRMVVYSTVEHLMNFMASSPALPSHVIQEVPRMRSLLLMTLTSELLAPESEAIASLLELPEMAMFLRKSTFSRLTTSSALLNLREILSAVREDVNLIKTSHFLCTADVSIIVPRVERALSIIKRSFSLDVLKFNLVSGLKECFGLIDQTVTIPNTLFAETFHHVEPLLELYVRHLTPLVGDLQTCVRQPHLRPDTLISALLALEEFKMAAATPEKPALLYPVHESLNERRPVY